MRDQDGGEACIFKYSSQEGLIDNLVFEPKLRGEEINKPQGYLGKETSKQRKQLVQRPWGRHMPGKSVDPGDWCGWSRVTKEKSGREWHQRGHEGPDDRRRAL